MIEVDFNASQFRKNHKGLRKKNYVNLRCKIANDKKINMNVFSKSLANTLTWVNEQQSNFLLIQTRYFKTFSFLLKLKHRV